VAAVVVVVTQQIQLQVQQIIGEFLVVAFQE
jgi:hypothetical protein